MINIVVPMAGMGSRFANAGYQDPKPLISVMGSPMIKIVIDNLRPQMPHQFIFICQKTHVESYDLANKLKDWAPNSILIQLNGITEGAACTVLSASQYINNDTPLMIANSDQYIDTCIDDYLNQIEKKDLDGLIMTMHADDPKWSFVGLEGDWVTNVVEKQVISNEATVGIYNFRRGKDFVSAAKAMIADNERVNNEFYVAPAYNRLINQGAKIGVYNIGAEAKGMYGLGTPADLDLFLSLPIAQQVAVVNTPRTAYRR